MERIGPYEVLGELGRGGMARVVRGRHLQSGAVHALKLMDGVADPELVVRFRREAEALSALSGQGVVPVHAVGVERDRAWLAMELMPGGSLRDRLRSSGPLPQAEALEIVRRLAETLARAHARGVVHRDVKPENVLFDEQGRPRLADFGLARDLAAPSTLTASGTLLGTPGYLPPELMRGERAGAGSDLFALGVLLHELLSGRRPFVGATSIAQLESTLSGRREPPPAAPGRVLALIDRLLETDPARRPGAAEVVAALESLPGEARSAPWLVPALGGGGLVLAAAVGALLVSAGQGRGPPGPAQPATPASPSSDRGEPRDLVEEWCQEGPAGIEPARIGSDPRPELQALVRAALVARTRTGDPPEVAVPDTAVSPLRDVLVAASATRRLLCALADREGPKQTAPGELYDASRAALCLGSDRLSPAWKHALGAAVLHRLRLEMLPRRSCVARWETPSIAPVFDVPLKEEPRLAALRGMAAMRSKAVGAAWRLTAAAEELLPGDPLLHAAARILIHDQSEAGKRDQSGLAALLERVLALEASGEPWGPEECECLLVIRRTCNMLLANQQSQLEVSRYREALGGEVERDADDEQRYDWAQGLIRRLQAERPPRAAAEEVVAWKVPLADPPLLCCRAAALARLGGKDRLEEAEQLLALAADAQVTRSAAAEKRSQLCSRVDDSIRAARRRSE